MEVRGLIQHTQNKNIIAKFCVERDVEGGIVELKKKGEASASSLINLATMSNASSLNLDSSEI